MGGHLGSLEDDEWAVMGIAHALKQYRGGQRRHDRSPLVDPQLGWNRPSKRTPATPSEQVQAVRAQIIERRGPVDEALDRCPDMGRAARHQPSLPGLECCVMWRGAA